MNPKLMIWISVLLSALAQVCLKRGLTNFQQQRRDGSGLFSLVLGLTRQHFVWLWGICFVVATALWLAGLQRLDLSYAYPLVSLGYVLVLAISAVAFHERVDRNRWLAVAVICLGVTLIART